MLATKMEFHIYSNKLISLTVISVIPKSWINGPGGAVRMAHSYPSSNPFVVALQRCSQPIVVICTALECSHLNANVSCIALQHLYHATGAYQHTCLYSSSAVPCYCQIRSNSQHSAPVAAAAATAASSSYSSITSTASSALRLLLASKRPAVDDAVDRPPPTPAAAAVVAVQRTSAQAAAAEQGK